MNILNQEVYYIGFNANNAICNDNFFAGSITLYPTKERGNIFYSDKLVNDTTSNEFLEKYRAYIYQKAKQIQEKNPHATFICFNQKIEKLCSNMTDINIIKNNDSQLVRFLNDKFLTRNYVKNSIPILDYYFLQPNELNYDLISQKLNTNRFVIQASTGSGGDTTYLITCQEDLNSIPKIKYEYCVSEYVENIPLNITLIIGDDNIIYFPISAQLILLTDNKFKYVGADFNVIHTFDKNVVDKIIYYSQIIGNNVKEMGYRGILGIDYILDEYNNIFFMEMNPRFQSSSFLISLNLIEKLNTSIAELHYLAITKQILPSINLFEISNSFVNCNTLQQFSSLNNYSIIDNGYFLPNQSSIYRKLFKDSIIDKADFEKIRKYIKTTN